MNSHVNGDTLGVEVSALQNIAPAFLALNKTVLSSKLPGTVQKRKKQNNHEINDFQPLKVVSVVVTNNYHDQ